MSACQLCGKPIFSLRPRLRHPKCSRIAAYDRAMSRADVAPEDADAIERQLDAMDRARILARNRYGVTV